MADPLLFGPCLFRLREFAGEDYRGAVLALLDERVHGLYAR